MALKYAKKAKNRGSIDGIFWFGQSQDSYDDAFPSFQEACDQDHLAAKFYVGFCKYHGWGIANDEKEGKCLMEEVFNSSDRFWTFVHAYYLEYGLNGFEKNVPRTRELYTISRTQSLSDCSLLRPVPFPLSELSNKF